MRWLSRLVGIAFVTWMVIAVRSDLDTDDGSGVSLAPIELPPPPPETWSIDMRRSTMTDQMDVFLELTANEPHFCSWNFGSRKAELIVQCRENVTSVALWTGCHMTSGSYTTLGNVTYRLDDNQARTVSMTESNNSRALGLWRGGRAIPFIKGMFGHDTLRVRFTPFSDGQSEVTFNIAGIEEVVAPLRGSCGW